MYKTYVIFILTFYYSNIFVSCISEYPIVLIVSYDAFRYNYYDKGETPVLAALRQKGTHAPYLNNVFITKTFTNHHSIATGVYPEVHGVLGNSFYDNLYQKQINYSYEMWHYSDDALPIWIANEKKGGGRYSGIMMWPGNEYNYTGMRPTYQRQWDGSVKWEERVDGVIKWILDPKKPANLVLMYIEEPDSHGHAFGPDSTQFTSELRAMDSITKYLIDKLTYYKILNSVNIFFLSDHGMLSVTKNNIIDLRQYVSDDKYNRYETSPTLHIYPKKGEAEKVYKALKAASNEASFQVYKKSEIPERWHYKNNRRAPPIFAVANPPYVFHDFYNTIEYEQKKWNFTAGNDSRFGVHGYDNTDANMKPHFVAMGPLIRENFAMEPFETVDLYCLWAYVLGFPEYSKKTNGTFERVEPMLKSSSQAKRGKGTSYSNIGGAIIGVLFVGIAMGIAVYFVHRKLRLRHKSFFDRFAKNNFESTQKLLDNEELREET